MGAFYYLAAALSEFGVSRNSVSSLFLRSCVGTPFSDAPCRVEDAELAFPRSAHTFNLRNSLFLAAEQRHVGRKEPDPQHLEKPQRGDMSLLRSLKMVTPRSTDISLLWSLS
jgi:hypothetical protein